VIYLEPAVLVEPNGANPPTDSIVIRGAD